jgi:hypothetical protein
MGIGETGAGWDRGWVGQRGFEYVPDIEKIQIFYQTSTLLCRILAKKCNEKFKIV